MKVCIIGFSTIELSPYMEKYIKLLGKTEVEYFSISRELGHKKCTVIKNGASYQINCRKRKFFLLKLLEHLKWKNNVIKILKKEKPNRLVVLTQYPAFFLRKILLNDYKEKYYFDVRDYNKLFTKRFIKTIIDNSIYTFISSEGFRKWLPSSDKLVVNNNLPQEIVYFQNHKIDYKSKISIAYFGAFSYLEENINLLKIVGNNKKYEIVYAGFGEIEKDLKKFCELNNFSNVLFLGKFKREDKTKLYSNICLINAIYGCKSMLTTTALPNKFYDSLAYRIPIVASKGTYLGEIIEKEKIGFTVNLDLSDFEDNINSFINDYNDSLFNKKCEMLLKQYINEEQMMNDCFIHSISENI